MITWALHLPCCIFCDCCHPREEFCQQINVLLQIRRQPDGEELGFYHCSSVPQSSTNMGCTPTLSWQAPAPSSFWLVKCTAGISINKSNGGREESRRKKERERTQQHKIKTGQSKFWNWYEASKLQMCQ